MSISIHFGNDNLSVCVGRVDVEGKGRGEGERERKRERERERETGRLTTITRYCDCPDSADGA